MAGDDARKLEHHARPPRSDDLGVAVDAVRRLMRELRLIMRKSELATGLSAAQNFVLTAIAERPGISVNEVAVATLTDRSSAAAVIDRLAENGLVVRSQSPQDRRRAVLTATPLGRRALREASPPPTIVLIKAMRRLTASDRRALATGLTALTVAMGIANQPAGMLFEDVPPPTARRKRNGRG
jgi:DNA-binding MarR family transcriptional regulator